MAEKKKKNTIQAIMAGLIIVAAFAIGSMWTELRLLRSGSGGSAKIQAGDDTLPEEVSELSGDALKEILKDPAAMKGSDKAKVTLVEFSDYQCPFCKRHFDETASQLQKEYIDTGKVKHVLRDLPLAFHANANLAAQAARCAGDQDRYFEFHDKLFETQTVWGEAEGETLFKGYAGSLGLNQGEFNSCLDGGKYVETVAADLALAQKVGANGTPTFFINGKILVGAQPFSTFKAMIDAEL